MKTTKNAVIATVITFFASIIALALFKEGVLNEEFNDYSDSLIVIALSGAMFGIVKTCTNPYYNTKIKVLGSLGAVFIAGAVWVMMYAVVATMLAGFIHTINYMTSTTNDLGASVYVVIYTLSMLVCAGIGVVFIVLFNKEKVKNGVTSAQVKAMEWQKIQQIAAQNQQVISMMNSMMYNPQMNPQMMQYPNQMQQPMQYQQPQPMSYQQPQQTNQPPKQA